MAFPSNPVVGDTYSEDGYVYFYNGQRWSAGWGASHPNGDIISHHIAPSSPAVGMLWHTPATNDVKRYNGSSWDLVGNIGV